MSRACSVCDHAGLEEIDQALVAGESRRGVASRFDLTESSVRRHHENHLDAHPAGRSEDDQEAEMFFARLAHGAPRDAEEEAEMALISADESPRVVAERRLRDEQDAARAARLGELEREEAARRERERGEHEREQRRASAGAEAATLAAERREVEGRAEAKVDELLGIFEEISGVDRRQREALRRAGTPVLEAASVDALIAGWLANRMGRRYVPDGRDPWGSSGLRTLAERDPLTQPRGGGQHRAC